MKKKYQITFELELDFNWEGDAAEVSDEDIQAACSTIFPLVGRSTLLNTKSSFQFYAPAQKIGISDIRN